MKYPPVHENGLDSPSVMHLLSLSAPFFSLTAMYISKDNTCIITLHCMQFHFLDPKEYIISTFILIYSSLSIYGSLLYTLYSIISLFAAHLCHSHSLCCSGHWCPPPSMPLKMFLSMNWTWSLKNLYTRYLSLLPPVHQNIPQSQSFPVTHQCSSLSVNLQHPLPPWVPLLSQMSQPGKCGVNISPHLSVNVLCWLGAVLRDCYVLLQGNVTWANSCSPSYRPVIHLFTQLPHA